MSCTFKTVVQNLLLLPNTKGITETEFFTLTDVSKLLKNINEEKLYAGQNVSVCKVNSVIE